MDGEHNYGSKPYEQMDDLGVPLFLETPIWIPSGQISSRPHRTDFPRKVAVWKRNRRLFQGNLGW